MPGRTDPTSHEGRRGDPEEVLDRLLSLHRTQLTNTVAEALDVTTGKAALAPLRRELFHGLKALKLDGAAGSPVDGPVPGGGLQEVLARLRDIRLMVERMGAGVELSADVQGSGQAVVVAVRRLHAGLQARSLTYDQVHVLFRELRERTACIGTSMLGLRTPLPQHTVEGWLRAIGALDRVERTVLRLFRDADDNVPTQG